MNMTRKQFLQSMDKLIELPRGTLNGTERLNELEQWNSMAVIGFIALVDSNNRTCPVAAANPGLWNGLRPVASCKGRFVAW